MSGLRRNYFRWLAAEKIRQLQAIDDSRCARCHHHVGGYAQVVQRHNNLDFNQQSRRRFDLRTDVDAEHKKYCAANFSGLAAGNAAGRILFNQLFLWLCARELVN